MFSPSFNHKALDSDANYLPQSVPASWPQMLTHTSPGTPPEIGKHSPPLCPTSVLWGIPCRILKTGGLMVYGIICFLVSHGIILLFMF